MLYKNWGQQEFSKFSQHDGKLPLPSLKQGNCQVIPIHAGQTQVPVSVASCDHYLLLVRSLAGIFFTAFTVSPGHVTNLLLCTAFSRVALGGPKEAWCRYWTRLAFNVIEYALCAYCLCVPSIFL